MDRKTDSSFVSHFHETFQTSPLIFCSDKYQLKTIVIAGMIAQGETFKLNADNLRYLYLLTLDGGDTESLEDFVENTWGSQVWETREELLEISPFVTRDVLLKMVDNTSVYPHAMAFEILLANSTVLSEPSFVTYLSQKSDPLPESLIDLLMSMSGSVANARSTMETALGDERTRQHTSLDEAYWSMLEYEDDTYSTTDYISVLEKMNTFNSECAIAELLMQDGQWSSALSRVQNLPNVVGLTKTTKREYESYLPWVTLLCNLTSAGRSIESMNSIELQALELIAAQFDTYAALAAQQLLRALDQVDYFVPPAFGKNGSIRSINVQQSISDLYLEVFPNPGDYVVNIRLKQSWVSDENCSIIVTDLQGKEVNHYTIMPHLRECSINTSDWANGLYLVQVKAPNLNFTIHGKFEVTH